MVCRVLRGELRSEDAGNPRKRAVRGTARRTAAYNRTGHPRAAPPPCFLISPGRHGLFCSAAMRASDAEARHAETAEVHEGAYRPEADLARPGLAEAPLRLGDCRDRLADLCNHLPHA